MADLADFDTWLQQLECPQLYASEHVKKTLHKGVLGLLWEDVPKIIRPQSEVLEVRKNVLLYKVKKEPKDSLINSVRNTVQLQKERKLLDIKIKNAELRWNQQELICRQKANLLEKKKVKRGNLRIKKEILKIKHEQMLMQIENCNKMQEICQHLMPPVVEEISQSTILDCLSLVANYTGGSEKKKVWKKIAELLNPVKISILWNALLAVRSHYTDFLIHLDIEENEDSTNKVETSLDVGIAKICSEHLDSIATTIIHSKKIKNNEIMTMEYVEKIEQIIEKQRSDLNDWLPLTLEVKKLETFQFELQRGLEKLEEQLPVDSMMLDDDLTQLMAEIKSVDLKTVDCVQEIQNAFLLLKSSGMLITKTKESLLSELEKFQLLQTTEENQSQWLQIDLSNELNVFQNNIETDALRKIMLKGETGAYKHLRTCFNQSSISVDTLNRNDNNVSIFPMIRVPIYYLVDYYKSFIANVLLNKRINEETMEIGEDFMESPIDSPILPNDQRGLFELLRLTDVACKRTFDHSEEFEQILKMWSKQSVREIVSKIFFDKTVYGATLDEWQKRFSMIVYVLQKMNMNVA